MIYDITEKPKPSYKTVFRAATILFYMDPSRNQYDGSLQIQIAGTTGTIHSLVGEGFYHVLKETGLNMFKELGLKRISVVISKSHLRLIQRALSGKAIIEVKDQDTVAGKDLIRVEMTEA